MQHSFVGRGAIGAVTALIVVAVTACGGDNGTGPGDDRVTTTSVTVTTNQTFDPADIRVSPGATVTWTWAPNNEDHNVVFDEPSITDSGVQDSGTFSTAMPTTPGTYNYLCQFHVGMEGSVLVE